MASVLASQLAQLARAGPQEKWLRGKASLLFSYQQAADVGADTLLSIAQTGGVNGSMRHQRGVPGGAAGAPRRGPRQGPRQGPRRGGCRRRPPQTTPPFAAA